MKHGVIRKADVSLWFDSLKGKGRIYGPKKRENAFVFRPVNKFEEMSLVHIPTILPPKKLLLRFTVRPFGTAPATARANGRSIVHRAGPRLISRSR